MRITAFLIVFLCCFNCNASYSMSIQEKLNRAEKYVSSGDLSRAIYTYELMALDMRNNKGIKANAWHKASVLYEDRLREYGKAFKIYKRLKDDYPEYERLDDVNRRMTHVERALDLYKEPMAALEDIRFGDAPDRKIIISDIKRLKHMIKNYPEFHNTAKLHALLGNRYIMISKWFRAYLYCRKASSINPDLSSSSPLGRDYIKAKGVSTKILFTRLAVVFLGIYMVLIIGLKPWKHINSRNLKLCFIVILGWFILASIIYSLPLLNFLPKSFPLLKGIDTPDSLSPPVYVLLWYRSFIEGRFWLFMIYTVIAVILIWFGVLGITAKGGRSSSVPIVAGFVVVTVSLLTLFYFNHCSWGFRYKNFLFHQEDSDIANKKYPDIFMEVTTLEENEK